MGARAGMTGRDAEGICSLGWDNQEGCGGLEGALAGITRRDAEGIGSLGWDDWEGCWGLQGRLALQPEEPAPALRPGWRLHAPTRDRTVPSSGYFPGTDTAVLPTLHEQRWAPAPGPSSDPRHHPAPLPKPGSRRALAGCRRG